MPEILGSLTQKEDELNSLLNQLPMELREKWRDQTDGLADIDEAISLVQETLSKRSVAKEKIFTTIQQIENPELQEEVRAVARKIDQVYGNNEYEIGQGTVGKVYFMPFAPHVCVKYIYNEHMLQKHGNTMRQEVDYLLDLDKFSVAGIRSPKVYFRHNSSGIECFGMERIDGMSLDKIIESPEACPFLETLRNQDMFLVIARVKQYIEKMHSEMKVVHRDLATRNIMVDKDGNWFIIDFGKAKRIEFGDSTTDMSEKTDGPSAENSIRKLFMSIN